MNSVVAYGRHTPLVIDTLEGALSLVENAYIALTEAVDFQSTRRIANLAVAAAAFAREAKDTRLLDRATELRTRAERKAGQMLRDAATKGERATQDGSINQHTRVSSATTPTPPGADRRDPGAHSARGGRRLPRFEADFEAVRARHHEDHHAARSTEHAQSAASVGVQQVRERTTLADDDSVAMPPLVVATHEAQAVAFYNAVRDLAAIACSVAELREALPYYQHFRIKVRTSAPR